MLVTGFLACVAFASFAAAENGLDAWLRYAPLPGKLSSSAAVPNRIVVLNSSTSSPVFNAGLELRKGFRGILGKELEFETPISPAFPASSSSVIVGTVADFQKFNGSIDDVPMLAEDGFWLSTEAAAGGVVIVGQNERGALYGAFEYLSMLAQGNFSRVSVVEEPAAPIRWVNQWDNMNGYIERGYGGFSLWFANDGVVSELPLFHHENVFGMDFRSELQDGRLI